MGFWREQNQAVTGAVCRRPRRLVRVGKFKNGFIISILQFDCFAAIAQRSGIGKDACHWTVGPVHSTKSTEVAHDENASARGQRSDGAAGEGEIDALREMYAIEIERHRFANIEQFDKFG